MDEEKPPTGLPYYAVFGDEEVNISLTPNFLGKNNSVLQSEAEKAQYYEYDESNIISAIEDSSSQHPDHNYSQAQEIVIANADEMEGSESQMFTITLYGDETSQSDDAEYYLSDTIIDETANSSFTAAASTSSETTQKKRISHPENWKQNIRKNRRNRGQKYLNSKNVLVPARTLKPRKCKERKCKFDCKYIDNAQRHHIFTTFWALGSVEQQWLYISACMVPMKITKINPGKTRRATNYIYHLENFSGEQLRVCKHFFLATLSVGDRFIRNIEKKAMYGDQRGRHDNHKTIPNVITNLMIQHIESVPRLTIPSFVPPEKEIGSTAKLPWVISNEKTRLNLYNDYLEKCENENCGTYDNFRHVFTKLNVQFNKLDEPEDSCSFCTELKDNLDNANNLLMYDGHIQECERSIEEKKIDTQSAKSGACITACLTELKSLLTPYGDDRFYYKHRLYTYYFTIYDVWKETDYGYTWYEGVANAGFNEIGTCIYKFLLENRFNKPIILYANNLDQIKNRYIVALCIYMVETYRIPSITMKFLHVNHNNNQKQKREINNFHSIISNQKITVKRRNKTIHTPGQWNSLIRTSLQAKYKKVETTQLDTGDIINFIKLSEVFGENYIETDENEIIEWSDIKIIEVSKGNGFSFKVKTSYDAEEQFKTIDIAKHVDCQWDEMQPLERAYSQPPGIEEEKKQDLMDICGSCAILLKYVKPKIKANQ